MDTENEYRGNAFLLQIRNIFKTDILRLIFFNGCSVIIDLNFTVEQEKQRKHWFVCALRSTLVSLTCTDDNPVSFLQNVLLT